MADGRFDLWDGEPRPPAGGGYDPIVNPATGEVIGEVARASSDDLDAVLQRARDGARAMRELPAHRRSRILAMAADRLEAEAERFARLISEEIGKTIRDSRAEVGRGPVVLRLAAAEALNRWGLGVPMDAVPGSEGRLGFTVLEPRGVVAAIVPFNFPLNLLIHKVAPALAAGNAVVVKPASAAVRPAFAFGELLASVGLPAGAYCVVTGPGPSVGRALVSDPRVDMLSFTGSVPVGRELRALAGVRPVTLELGSNSPNIVFADADLDRAVGALVPSAFGFAGQICISAQRVFVEGPVFEEFLDRFVERTRRLRSGDPLAEETDLSPMIRPQEVERVASWVAEGVAGGGRIACGGEPASSRHYEPTVVVEPPRTSRLVREELFGPAVGLFRFDDVDEAVAGANDSRYGLQAGIFTSDLTRAVDVARRIRTGGVWINEASTVRQQNAPYGGVGESGLGREGVRWAIREMSEEKFIGIRP